MDTTNPASVTAHPGAITPAIETVMGEAFGMLIPGPMAIATMAGDATEPGFLEA